MVPCSYDRNTVDLQLIGEELDVGLTLPCSNECAKSISETTTPPLMTSAIVLPSNDTIHDVMLRFQRRTALTLGTEATKHVYAEVVPRLAMRHEHLLHAIHATTFLHDRSLAGSPHSTLIESYHLSRAASLFNQKLSRKIPHEDRDALWATAVYLCAMAVFKLDTSNPEEAWPLRTPHPTDLEWLNMQAGLRVVWDIALVNRIDSMFGYIETNSKANCVYPDLPRSGVDGIPRALVDLCGLTPQSTGSNNPYHAAVRYLSRLLPVEGSSANILSFMVFAGGMTKDFKWLLWQKEPRALLILAVWYSKLFHSTWWMCPRARIECQAIWRYLDRRDDGDRAFVQILRIVGVACAHMDAQAALALLDEPGDFSQPTKLSKKQSSVPNAPTSKKIDLFWVT